MPPDPTLSRQRKACMACRSLKTRCLPTPNAAPKAPCLRCAGLGLNCVYRSAKRGPRKGWKLKEMRETVDPDPEMSAHSSESYEERLVSSSGLEGTSADMLSVGEPLFGIAASPSRGHDGSVRSAATPSSTPQHSEPRPPTQPPAGAFFANEGSALEHPRPLTLEHYLEPDVSGRSTRCDGAAPWLSYIDPVAIGLLSEAEARYLFWQFMERVAPHEDLFDPVLHTYERVHSSLPLFTAVMFAATRFFRPELSVIFLDHAETNVNRAQRRDDIDIMLCQALLVLVLWKRPCDRTAYQKLGIVTRLLLQLRVSWDTHKAHTSLEEERLHVDVERTIYTFEIVYSLLFRLPASTQLAVPDFEEMVIWERKHRHLNNPGDAFKVYLADMLPFHLSPAGDLWFKSAEEWQERQTQHRARVDKWQSNGLMKGATRAYAELPMRSRIVTMHFLALQRDFIVASPFLDEAERYALAIKTIAIKGDFQFYSETRLCQLSILGTLVYQARTQFSAAELIRAQHLVSDLRRVFDELPAHVTHDHALEYIQRNYRRLDDALDGWTIASGGQEDLDLFLAQIGFPFGDDGAGPGNDFATLLPL